MGHRIDPSAETVSAETRELAWELNQNHPDQMRIKYLIENQADIKTALSIANLRIEQINKKPLLRQLHLEKMLH